MANSTDVCSCAKCGTTNTNGIVYEMLNCHTCGKNRRKCSCKRGFDLCPVHPICRNDTPKIECAKCETIKSMYCHDVFAPDYCHRCGWHLTTLCDCDDDTQKLCPVNPVNYVKPKQPCPDCGDIGCTKDPCTNTCMCPQCGEEFHPGEKCICHECGDKLHSGQCRYT